MDTACDNTMDAIQCAVNQALFNVLLLQSKPNGARLSAMAMCPAISTYLFDKEYHFFDFKTWLILQHIYLWEKIPQDLC